MTQYNYCLCDTEARMVRSASEEHHDILDAFEHMHTLLGTFDAVATVQLWQQEKFIGQIARADGRLILKRQSDPLPGHPLFGQDSFIQDSAETHAS